MQSSRRINLLVLGVTLVLALAAGVAADTKPARVVVLGQPYSGSPSPQLKDGVFWGPVVPLARMLGAEVTGNAREIHIATVAGERFSLAAGESLLREGERTHPLEAAPVVAAGRLVAPLPRVLSALGARVMTSPAQALLTASARLRAIEISGHEGGLRVHVRTTAPIVGRLTRLPEENRVFVDLPEVVLEGESRQYLGAAGVLRLRTGQFESDPPTARFVLDLYGSPEVRWNPTPDGGVFVVGAPGESPPRFVPQAPRLVSADLQSVPGESSQLTLRFSGPVSFNSEIVRPPYRLALTFPDATGEALTCADPADVPLAGLQVAPQPEGGLRAEVLLGWLMRFAVAQDASCREVRLTMRREPLAGKRIVIDPGHGGKDRGASYAGLDEKVVNLDVATQLVTRLTLAGARAYLTRDSDTFLDLPNRPAVATALSADAFVSVHCNAMPRANLAHGTESYYYTPQSEMLAHVLHYQLVQGLGRRDNGVRQRKFAVLWRAQNPSALVELMYLDWDAENALLRLPETRRRASAALFTAIQGYFEGLRLGGSSQRSGSIAPQSAFSAHDPRLATRDSRLLPRS